MTAVTPVERWPAELQRVVDYWAAADGVYVLPEGQRRLAAWIHQCQAAEYRRQQHEAAARAERERHTAQGRRNARAEWALLEQQAAAAAEKLGLKSAARPLRYRQNPASGEIEFADNAPIHAAKRHSTSTARRGESQIERLTRLIAEAEAAGDRLGAEAARQMLARELAREENRHPGEFRWAAMAAEDDSGAKQAEDPITAAEVLDALQVGLDVVGTFEPTPFADLANATISAARGNWFDAAVTAAGALPGLGDSLKALKYSEEALAVARGVRHHAEEAADAARALSRRAEEAAQAASHTADDYRDAARYTHSYTTLDAVEAAAKRSDDTTRGAAKGPRQLHRPYIRKRVRKDIETEAPRTPDGRLIDPNTMQPIEGKPDLGHKPGHEFWREKTQAEAEGVLQSEFNDRMNDPELYQLEDPSSSRSHRFEKPK